jgi:hypothetical protein
MPGSSHKITNKTYFFKAKFKDTKRALRSHKSKKDNTMPKQQRIKRQAMIYKTLHRKLKTEQIQKNNLKQTKMNSGATEGESSFGFTSGTCRVTVKRHEHRIIWKS